MPHRLVMTGQVRDWLHALRSGEPGTRRLVAEAIDRRYAEAIPAAEALYEAYLEGQR